MSEINSSKSGKRNLLLLAVVFLLPFTIAVILHLLDIRPSGKSYGELIAPPVALTLPVLKDAQDKPISWQKKWNIVMIVRSNCDEACQATTHLLGNVRLSLAKDTKRVQQVMLFPSKVNVEAVIDLKKKNPDLIILSGEEALSLADRLEKLGKPQAIYLVDPLGNLMMQYPQNFEPKGLRGDLVRLIKSSWVG